MKHLFILILFISFSLGIVSIAISALLFLKSRIRALKYYLIILSSFISLILLHSVLAYMRSDVSNFQVHTNKAITVFNVIVKTMVIYAMPLFFFEIILKKIPKSLINLTKIITVLFFSTLFVDFFIGGRLVIDIRDLFVWFIGLLGLTLLIINFKNIKFRNISVVLKLFIILHLIFVPTQIAYVLWPYLGLSKNIFSSTPFVFVFYYIVWNIINIVCAAKYFSHPFTKNEFKIKEEFISMYYITEREKEIIFFLCQGHSNKYIGSKLFISPKTVRNHIYNIYRKTEVKNRIELMNLANS